jgi:predicted aldo/keto reductase-like oxidoreductase
MSPLGGGKFVISPEIIKDNSLRNNSSAEIALNFVLCNEDVDVVLSGMKNIRELEENINIVSSESNGMTQEYIDKLNKMIIENEKIADCYCTECTYCLPCTKKINIPYVLRLLNFHRVDGLTEYAKQKFTAFKEKKDVAVSLVGSTQPIGIGENPAACIACGVCEKKCPQRLKIPQKLSEAVKELSGSTNDDK